jgi:hypothetical protein
MKTELARMVFMLAKLKGTWQWGGFSWVFAEIVPHESFTLTFGPFRFWLRIRGDIRIRKTTPAITDTGSRRLGVSVIQGVANSPHHWYAESPIPRITDTESRLFNFLKENSLYRWYGESSTPRTSDTVSCRLPVPLSRIVADSAYHRYGESPTPRIVESGSRRLRGSVTGSRYSK